MLLDRSFNFLARPRRRKRRKKKKSIFLPKERIIPLDSTIEKERERERLYDVITFSQGDVKSLGSDTSFSREKERERDASYLTEEKSSFEEHFPFER